MLDQVDINYHQKYTKQSILLITVFFINNTPNSLLPNNRAPILILITDYECMETGDSGKQLGGKSKIIGKVKNKDFFLYVCLQPYSAEI